jgi:hypothetical protein
VLAHRLSPIQQCLHGGWQSLVSDDGTPFANQGACASYLARGGILGCPAPAVGTGPLTGGNVVGPGHFDGQACPAIGVFWRDDAINLRCYLIAGRTVRAITIYDAFGSPAGHLDIADVAVPPMPAFTFGSTVESAPLQLTLPVLTTNAEGVSALQIYSVPNAPGYGSCGSGSEFSLAYFAPTDPNARFNTPSIQVVSWSDGAITLDFSNVVESESYPGGFTLCGVVAYWGSYIAVGTAFPAAPFTFG